MWNKVGMGRTPEGLKEAIKEIEEVRNDFWKNVKVPGEGEGMNTELEKAFRVADFLELGQLMAIDALNRKNLVEDISVKITQLRMEKRKEMT
jgi:succinate dehydrogenase / fumarate reductase flavoprotein subunit